MAITLFYITNAAVLIGCLLVAWGIFFHGRPFGDDLRLKRRIVAAAFSFLALHCLSMLTIIHPEVGGVEVYATQPIGLLYVVFIVLVMGGTAVMHRQYHRNFALWVLMLLIPFAFLLVNILMIASGLYQPVPLARAARFPRQRAHHLLWPHAARFVSADVLAVGRLHAGRGLSVRPPHEG